mmetsp:Transcript_22172/g.18984  ORF Transcript_22172/g.18984 Transcript_22172/m.18984 type:complete len:201 (-) Transcript_22172:560-1162(-)
MSKLNKLYKTCKDKPNAHEEAVAGALHDLENSSTELKSDLKYIYVAGVQEFEFSAKGKKGKNTLVVSVPFPCLPLVRRCAEKLIPEVEKKLKAPVIFIAKRTIQSKWHKIHKSQKRPRSRTLTAVHDAILDDLVLPGGIIGRRIRHKADGSSIQKVFLDQHSEKFLKDKIDIIANIYKRLTTKDVQFEFKSERPFYVLKA